MSRRGCYFRRETGKTWPKGSSAIFPNRRWRRPMREKGMKMPPPVFPSRIFMTVCGKFSLMPREKRCESLRGRAEDFVPEAGEEKFFFDGSGYFKGAGTGP